MAKRKTWEDKGIKPQTADDGQQTADGGPQAGGGEMVRVRILPGRGIGGYGRGGDVVEMTRAEAERWVREGYVEFVDRGQQTADGGE